MRTKSTCIQMRQAISQASQTSSLCRLTIHTGKPWCLSHLLVNYFQTVSCHSAQLVHQRLQSKMSLRSDQASHRMTVWCVLLCLNKYRVKFFCNECIRTFFSTGNGAHGLHTELHPRTFYTFFVVVVCAGCLTKLRTCSG